ncbi:MAG: DNA polymerase III subunit chi [Proteobacteria bacterium]|nr:DNA polymerase III subunit chi [Pseudomonadota bacterium]
MTEVVFHFNVPDKLHYACRLLRKAYAAGDPVGVVASPEQLQTLDTTLWSFSALDFIPHCRASAPAPLLQASPIVLASAAAELPQAAEVLVHLGETVPAGFERFSRLIELVAADDADRGLARQRWRHYADRGYAITHHDLAQRS